MKRRDFTYRILTLSGGIFLIRSPLMSMLPSNIGLNRPLPPGGDPIIDILNNEAINSLSTDQLHDINKYFTINSFSSDLVPYASGVKLDSNSLERFIEHKAEQSYLEYQENIRSQQRLDFYNSQRTQIASAATAVGAIVVGTMNLPILAVGLGVISAGTAIIPIFSNSYDNTYSLLYNEINLKSELTWRIDNNHLNDISSLPNELRGRFVTTKQEAIERLRSPNSLKELGPQAKGSLLSLTENGQSQSKEQVQENKDNILSSVFERVGAMTDMLSSTETRTEPAPGEKEQQLALIGNFHRLGNVLISQYAGEDEQKLLSVAFNSGMNYLSMAAVSAIHPVGWAALGVGLATDLLGAFGKSKSGGLEAAFKAIFKQLQQIQKSLQRVEQRQIYMISKLQEIYLQLKDVNHKLDELQDQIESFRTEFQEYFVGEFRREREELINSQIKKQQIQIWEIAEQVYTKKGVARWNYLRRSDSIKNLVRPIYNFILADTQLEAFNGTGNAINDNRAIYNPTNGQLLKNKIFGSAYNGDESIQQYNDTLLYTQVGVLPYLYQIVFPGETELKYDVCNSQALNEGVIALMEVLMLLPQKELLKKEDRQIWIKNIKRLVENQRLHLNKLASKDAVDRMTKNYLLDSINYVFNIQKNLLQVTNEVKEEDIFTIDINEKPAIQAQLKNFRKEINLNGVESNFKNFSRQFPAFAFPFVGFVSWDKAPVVMEPGLYGRPTGTDRKGYEGIEGKKFIKDYVLAENAKIADKLNVTKAERYFDTPGTFDIVEIIQSLQIATISKEGTASAVIRYDGRNLVDKNTMIGEPYEVTLKKMTISKDIPVVGGLHIYFSESKNICSMIQEFKYESYGHDGDRERRTLNYMNPRKFYQEYSFSPISKYFSKQMSMHWKFQISEQLLKLNRKDDLKKIPGFDTMSIMGFMEFILNKGIDCRIKTKKINEILKSTDNNIKFDFSAASLFMTLRMNQNIASQGSIPFSANYANLAFRSEDIFTMIKTLRHFDPYSESGKALIQRLVELELKEKQEMSFPAFKIETSVFYYKELQPDGTWKTEKLSLYDFYQFIIIAIRLLIVDTYHYVSKSSTELSDEHSDPCLAHASYVINSYKDFVFPEKNA